MSADMALRPARASDWESIGLLADEAVAHVPGAGSQDEWYSNRHKFDTARGVQRQYVVEDAIGAIVGYGAVESVDGAFRLFVVTPPDRLPTVGELLYTTGMDVLRELGARSVWFTEYAADDALVAFATAHGFREERRVSLSNGVEAITLTKELS